MNALRAYLRGLSPEELHRLRGAAELFENGVVEDVVEVELPLVNLGPPVVIGGMIEDIWNVRAGVLIGVSPAERLVCTEHGWMRMRRPSERATLLLRDLMALETHALPLRDALLGRA